MGQPGTARLEDAAPHHAEPPDRMSVGRDHHPHAGPSSGCRVVIVEVETARMGIDFQERARRSRSRDHRFHVDVVGGAAIDEAAGGMPDDPHRGMADRLQDPLRDPVPGL